MEQTFHRFARGESFDRSAEVFVGIALASEQAREFGQDVMEVPAVGDAQEIVGDREIENEQVSTWLEHTTHFAQRSRVVGHVAKAEGDSDAVEARIIEGQTQGIGNHRAADAAA